MSIYLLTFLEEMLVVMAVRVQLQASERELEVVHTAVAGALAGMNTDMSRQFDRAAGQLRGLARGCQERDEMDRLAPRLRAWPGTPLT